MKWLREAFLGNWRNKGVAMFFAITIWFVAYQSEKQETKEEFTVAFQPENPDRYVITSLKVPSPQPGGREEHFDGRIRVQFSGPRKLIDDLRNFVLSRELAAFKVPFERESYHKEFDKNDFEFVGKGVAITSVSPPWVQITQEELDSVTIKDLASRLLVTHRLQGYVVAPPRVEPNEVRVIGPKSILDTVNVRLNFSMELREENEGDVDVIPDFTDETVPEFFRKTVRVEPNSVRVAVTSRAQTETLSLDAVRISFRIPLPRAPIDIISEDLARGTIPVELYGPEDQIKRLEDLYKKNSLVLSVPVRQFPRDQDSLRTFEERDLELYGFPGVQVRKHESRREKGPWNYRIVRERNEN